ncbi:hypothetical protein PHET_12185 [Paragonimus heterotremus]|uniref:P53 and DNA damage-regulated protein 1 n=1 Tax=Paragonimus heterotremus TaxID=100268 RepID=A0A8J4WCA5_9TREM|nr:hypothetical protein PHET_12185 [Paragonimus heterotremus]
MTLNVEQQKLISHLEQIEEVGELVLAKQEQCVQCDKSRQHTREALRALFKLQNTSKHWIMLSNQFFCVPHDNLKQALEDDLKVYNNEIEKNRKEIKEDIKLLNELEGTTCLKGFDLISLSKADTDVF